MLRELGGLACAPLWAISSIMLKSQTGKVDALRINALRSIFASAFLIIVALFSGRLSQLADLPPYAIFYLYFSVVIGMVVGDTLYIKGMGLIGVARALPISITYPIFVLPFSAIIIGESLTALTLIGVFITAIGLCVITAPQKQSEEVSQITRKQYWRGVSFLLIASFCWAIGTITLKFGVAKLDPIVAAAIRMPFMALVLLMIIFVKRDRGKKWYYGPKSLTVLALGGILGIGLGGLFFMLGIKYAGTARTAILSATAPLFGVPLSMIFLHEKITLRIVLGTILCVFGIWLVI